MVSESWELARGIRERHLGKGALTDAICAAMNAQVDAWLADRDTEEPKRSWWTAQLEDGQLTGHWSDTRLDAQVWCEIWRGAAVHWIEQDPDAAIYYRYLDSASSADSRSREARTFALTAGSVLHPTRPTRELAWVTGAAAGDALFDF